MILTVGGLRRSRGGVWPPSHLWLTWPEFEAVAGQQFQSAGEDPDAYRAILDITESVSASGLSEHFVANFGLHYPRFSLGLVALEPELREEILVLGPGVNFAAMPGNIRIRHESFTGKIEDIQRPIAEAVPLFWSFVAEKFGIFYPL